MNKKNIQIAIVAVMFLASGLIVYNGLLKKPSSSAPPVSPGQVGMSGAASGNVGIPQAAPAAGNSQTAGKYGNIPVPAGFGQQTGNTAKFQKRSDDKILPYGENFDLEILKKNNFVFGMKYPTLDPSVDLGKAVGNLISPDVSGGGTSGTNAPSAPKR